MLKGLCEIVHFLLNTVITATSFILGQHHVFVIAIFTGECARLIPKKYGLVYVIAAIVYWPTMILLFYYASLKTVTELFFSQKYWVLSNCGISEHNFFAADKAIHNLQFLITWPGTERDLFSIVIFDLISRSALVRFSLSHARYYYNLTGLVWYVYSV